MIKKYISYSEEDTYKIGREIAEKLTAGTVVLLDGDLGTGKTVLTKGICDYFNVKNRVVSPTYTLVNEYIGDIKIYHFDIYRLSDEDELYNIGFTDYLTDDAIVIVEWANNVSYDIYGENTIKIEISRSQDLVKGNNYASFGDRFFR